MNIEKDRILASVGLPARLDVPAVAVILNFGQHDIPVLVSVKLLDPLGRPAANAPKYFARETILSNAKNIKWLSDATRAVATYWRKRREKVEDDSSANHAGLRRAKRVKTMPETPSTDSSTKPSITEQ